MKDTASDHDRDPLARAYDPEAFRRQGHALVDQLADYLGSALGGTLPVVALRPPEELAAEWAADFTPDGDGEGALGPLVARVLAQAMHQHHPRYVGHQVAVPLPIGALAELAAALLNNGMAAYESGPVSSAMERSVAGWLGDRLGLPSSRDGVLTSGGTLGNLTALLAARQLRAGFDVWNAGAGGGPPLAVLTSEHSHYSIARAAQVMGLGAGGVVPVAVDAAYRIRPDDLEAALARAEAAGRRVFAVVATAGVSATGSFDPIDAVADFCRARELWLHVDGAHGAAACLSEAYRPLLAGIERADSVVWDAHKLCGLPGLVTAVLFARGGDGYAAFAQRASYLFAPGAPPGRWFDFGLRNFECTKRMMSLKLYLALRVLGTDTLARYVTRQFDLARRFAVLLDVAPDFELGCDPTCNIVVFRHVPERDAEHQDRIRQRIADEGSFFLTRTTLGGRAYLRVTLMNPFTTEEDLQALLATVRRVAGSP